MKHGKRDPGLDRRAFLAAGAVAAGGALAAASPVHASGLGVAATGPAAGAPLGSGGTPMEPKALAALARRVGGGYPVLLLDLAALDRDRGVILRFAARQGWAVRPALKVFRSAELAAYVLERLPEPRGLVFNLSEVDALVAAGPRGIDLLCGYPPTVGELAAFLGARPPRGQKPFTLRLLVDSVPLMEELARLARSTPRRLPLDVALELDVGMGKGGMSLSDPSELEACVKLLRRNRPRLRLGAVLGYDGHATLLGDQGFRRGIAEQAQGYYRRHLAALERLGPDLYDRKRLIRNGPASSNYRNWAGGPANEISPGSAFLLAGYLLKGFDVDGLEPALTMAGSVRRITSGHPSALISGEFSADATEQEIVVQSVGAAEELAWPKGAYEDQDSGGGDALVVPKGAVRLGDYVLWRPEQTEVGIQRFDAMLAVREGRVLRRWRVNKRPGGR